MKKFTKKSLFLIISFFLGLNIILNAQTNVSGLISNNTFWNLTGSPYIITGNVLVDSGITLTIDPGVIIKFNQSKTLQVGGILHAVGTIDNPITFTSNQSIPAPGDWGFILFNQQSTAFDSTLKTGCIMKYCIIEYAGNQNVINCNAAIRLINAFPLIKNCTIQNNAVSGINYRDVTSPSNNGIIKILHCNINNNTSQTGGGGIDIIPNWATVTIKIDSNIIINNYSSVNGGGINCNINSGDISNNTITNNQTSGSGGGIYANSGNGVSFVISKNTIKNNTATNSNSLGGGIYASAGCCSGSTMINNNFILNNNTPKGSGGGIYTDYYANCYASYNLLYNNSAFSGGGMINKFYSVNVNNNIFANNATTSADNSILSISAGYFTNNTVIDNNSITQIINENFDISSSTSMNHNTIARNNFQSLFSQKKTINLYTSQGCGGCNPTIDFSNNNFNNKTTAYEIFNDNTAVYNTNAKNCWWGKTSDTAIDSVIWDYFDDASLGIVNYIPFQTTPDTTAPVTPPVNVVKNDLGDGNIQLTWNANHETDLAGYKVFYGSPTGYSFSNFINVGNDTTYTISGLAITDTIAVTAYDKSYNIDTTDLQNQLNGHESWFTNAVGKPIVNFTVANNTSCPGDTIFYFDKTVDASVWNSTWYWSFQGGTPKISYSQNPKVIYQNGGTYNISLVVSNIAGNDTLIKTNYITIHNQTYASLNPKVCYSYTSPSGKTWTSGGIYQDTIQNYTGCDSILTINLTVNNTSSSIIYPQTCNSYISPSGKYKWTVGGWYKDTITNAAGCDSIISLYLTVNKVDTNITKMGNTLIASPMGGTYNWLDCNNGYNPVPNETGQSFTPTENGSYALKITQNNCTDTSSCYNISTFVGIKEHYSSTKISLYPNPVDQILNIEFGNFINNASINVIDYTGRIVAALITQQTDKAIIDTKDFANGIYMVRIILDNDKTVNFKIVKN